ncbi:MAG TPA: methionine ABC transporter permease [Rhabdochlamydiaceae bacterium]|nr:methionine ABC transporter permease [Rhabdochlamydiaceae bacterium]
MTPLLNLLLPAFGETLYMVFAAAFFASLIGLPLGIILFLTKKGHLKENLFLHKCLGALVNLGRSFPFAILMVALIPFTRWIIGTSLGTTASIVPLSIAAAPFIARQVENCLNEIGKEILEATVVMGSTTWQIITKVLLVEALPALIQALTLTIINLIGYSAMAGLVGGGGLGTVAIQYGYQRFNGSVMFWTVVLLILLVEVVQTIGTRLTIKLLKKRGKVVHE